MHVVTASPAPSITSRLSGLDRSVPVWIVAALALLLLMALPLGWLAYLSVNADGGATLAHYRQVFTDPPLQKALWNTVVMAFWVGLASLAVGAPLAWLTARTDLPGQKLIRGLVSRSHGRTSRWATGRSRSSSTAPPGPAILNTLELGVLTACVGAGLAALLAYIANRKIILGHQFVAFLALAPVVIPGVVLAVALFIAYTRPPFLLYGTLWILFVAYLTKEMPVGYAQSDATFKGIQPDLEEAGRIFGAGRLRVLRDITAPLARSGIIAAWCFIFIGVIRELSASIILFTPNTKVMSVVIFDLKEEGQFGAIAVLGLFMLVMTFATVVLMQTVLGRDFLGARE